MSDRQQEPFAEPNLTGFLLVAHPGMMDPSFRRSIILVSAHSEEDGALGVVLNRPMGRRLSEIEEDFEHTSLGAVPLFYGGPVKPREMILTAWEPTGEPGMFKLFFGISPDQASELQEQNDDLILRGFLGYSGWSSGQLEKELHENAWFVSPLDSAVLSNAGSPDLWRRIITRLKPELAFLADAPEDPSMN